MSMSFAASITRQLNKKRAAKKRKPFAKESIGAGRRKSEVDFDFPEATPEQLTAIKEQMKIENRIQTVKTLCILLITLGVVIGGIWYLV